MTPADILDVTSATCTFLLNGHPPAHGWTALFRPGERIRPRVINASAMTVLDIRIPGPPMTVVQADGDPMEPVETDELRMGPAETYDVIVTPVRDTAHTIFGQARDRGGYAAWMLATRLGMRAPIPPLDPPPLRTMGDMGMDHGAHGAHGHGGGVQAHMLLQQFEAPISARPNAFRWHGQARIGQTARMGDDPTTQLRFVFGIRRWF